MYKNLVRELMIYCVAELLNLQKQSVSRILMKQPLIRNNITTNTGVLYTAELTGLEVLPKIDMPSEQPSVVIQKNKKMPLVINPDGSINISNTPTYLHQASKGVVFNKRTYGIYAHRQAGVKKASIIDHGIEKARVDKKT
jgi:hypothetical protein